MPPSPTGNLHIGGARTALFNYIFAKQNGGDFILRIDDTDIERNKKEYEDDIISSLSWLHLIHDEVYKQSERTEIYKEKLQQLVSSGAAYLAEENKDGSGQVVRLKNKSEPITFTDMILGEIKIDTADLGDFIIARDINSPLYHLASVVDDGELDISHVIRGQDHIMNTPRQILILAALGYELPKYAHIPLVLNSLGEKLSKRDLGVKSISEYRAHGILSESLINSLAFLGWNPGTEQEIYHIHELLRDFKIEKVQKKSAVFNLEKLLWFNRAHLDLLSETGYRKYLNDGVVALETKVGVDWNEYVCKRLIPTIREHVRSRAEFQELVAAGEYDYFFIRPAVDVSRLAWRDDTSENAKKHLAEMRSIILSIDEKKLSAEAVRNFIWDYAEKNGRGNVLWPLRYALSGQEKSPDPFTLVYILGKKEAVERISAII